MRGHQVNPTSPASSPEATQQKWRVGGKVPLNVYKGDRPIFQAHSIEDAREVVDGMNAATQQAAEQASGGQVAQRAVMSTKQMVARIAELEPLERFMQAWGEKHPRELKDEDFIADVKRDIAKCTKDRSEFSEPPVDCDHCHSFARLLQIVATTREIAGQLAPALEFFDGDTSERHRVARAALARAKAAGIASSPTEPPQAALPPSK